MGSSSDTYLLFGISVSMDDYLVMLGDRWGYWVDALASRVGIIAPPMGNSTREEYSHYRDRVADMEHSCSLRIATFGLVDGCQECGSIFVVAKHFHFCMYGAGSVDLGTGVQFEIPSDLVCKFETFCKLMDIPYSKPSWHLVSDQGVD